MVACKRFLVSGRVQGVFFRASTAQQATRLELTGWARNLSDGRVEVLARGTSVSVDTLERWLQHGPPVARVDNVVANDEDPADYAELNDFRTG